MEEKLKQIQTDYLSKIEASKTLKELDEIFIALFGKNGQIDQLSRQFKELSKDKLQTVGPIFNQIKQELEKSINDRRLTIKELVYKTLENETFSFEPQGLKARKGYMHPLTAFEEHTAKVFNKLGFVQIDAPHIDTDHNNFEVLNIPENHPARDLWDTLYIQGNRQQATGDSKLLLRTHASNSQIRALSQNKPPIRLMNIGRCFRYENLDARHEHTFEQFELVYVDKKVSMANLQYLAEYFLKNIFGEEIKARLKPKYYPFVEPGVGVDGLCIFCKGKGCKVCGGMGWLELAGAGMIHPKVLQAGGIDPNEYSGIAWGFGPARMAMIKYGTQDIRLFNSGDLSFLQEDRK